MTFIKYCVQLYKDNVAPMLSKLKRGGNNSPKKSIAVNALALQGRARRGNVLLNKGALEGALKDD
jgi:hypothetical protein